MKKAFLSAAAALVLSGLPVQASGVNSTNKFAFGENVGWLNFAPSNSLVEVHLDGTVGYLTGHAWAENIGWIKLGSGMGPYHNTASNNWGVNLDVPGSKLSGYAWSENTGWISFEGSQHSVRIDLTTGLLSGYAWGENIGWISMSGVAPDYGVELEVVPTAPLIVNPPAGVAIFGHEGGPFEPNRQIIDLSNVSTGTIDWTASVVAPWLSLSATSGSIAAGDALQLVIDVTSAANTLPTGFFTNVVTISNQNNGTYLDLVYPMQVVTGASIKVSPMMVSTTITETLTGSRMLTVSNEFGAEDVLSATLSSDASWLTLSGHQITDLPAGDAVSFTMNFDTAGLTAPGVYTGIVTIANNDQYNNPKQVKVVMVVQGDELVIDPLAGLPFLGHEGGPFGPAQHSYTLSNIGFAPLAWSSDAQAPWLTLTPDAGTIPAGSSTTVQVSVNASAELLPPGVFTNQVLVFNDAVGTIKELYFPLHVVTGSDIHVVSPLIQTSVVETLMTPVDLVISNGATAEAALSGMVTSTAPWLVLATHQFDGLAAGSVTGILVHLDATDLTPAVYTGELVITHNDLYQGPQTTIVELTVLPDVFAVSPTGLVTSLGRSGGPFVPSTHTYTLMNESTNEITWSAHESANWFSVVPSSGTLTSMASATVTLTVGSGANVLPEGSYTDAITFSNLLQGTTHDVAARLDVYNGPQMMVSPEVIAQQRVAGSIVTNYVTISNNVLAGGNLNAMVSSTSSWISVVEPVASNIAPGAAQDIAVVFNSAGLPLGMNVADIAVTGNDLIAPTQTVAVMLDLILQPLTVSPTNAYASAGFPGGPFTPASTIYELANSYTSPVHWAAAVTEPWLSVSPTGGTVSAGGTAAVTLSINDAATSNLASTTYHDVLTVSDLTFGGISYREVTMVVTAGPQIILSPVVIVVTNAGSQPVTTMLTVSNKYTASEALNINASADTNSATAFGVMAVGLQPYTGLMVDPYHDFTKIAAGEEYVPGEALVRFKSGVALASRVSALAPVGGSIIKSYGELVDGLVRVAVDEAMAMTDVLTTLNADPAILYAEPNYVVRSTVIPDDPSYSQLWGMPKIEAPSAWDRETGDRKIVVAVIDTGVDYNHPDLAANMWKNPGEIPGNGVDDDGNGWVDDVYGWDFINKDNDPMDDHSHGTHCAGTVGAVGNNGVGVVGVVWEVSIMALKFLSSGGSGSIADGVECILYATKNKAHLTSNSWGGGGYTQAMKDAIDAADAANIAFVAAAGNSNNNNDSSPFYPATYTSPNVISVLASDQSDNKASFSSYGRTTVDIGAPGVGTYSTEPGNRYGSKSGTSMATPHVSGACALLLSVNPRLTVAEYKQILMDSSDPIFPGLVLSGGRMNVYKALQEVRSSWLEVAPESITGIQPGSASDLEVTVYSEGLAPGVYNGDIKITSNDPRNPSNDVAVTLIVPDGLTMTPATALESSGRKGGPFSVTNGLYLLINYATNEIAWQAISTQDWVTLSTTGGVLAAGGSTTIGVNINENAGALKVGQYADTLVIRRPATGIEDRRSIKLDVYVTPEIQVNPLSLAVTSRLGQTISRTVNVGNETFADGELSFIAEVVGPIGTNGGFRIKSEIDWLSVTPGSVTNLLGGNTTNLIAVFDAGNLDAGTYVAEILLDSNDRRTPRVTIPVTYTILPEDLKVGPVDGFIADGPEGGPFVPPSTVYGITNNGSAPLTWTVSHGADWLDVFPTNGLLMAGADEQVTVSLNTQASILPPGTYTNTLVFSNQISGATILRGVRLKVTPQPFLCITLDDDPEWAMEGMWAFGVPQGGGSALKDPTSGRTGSNVLGYNLAGNYENNLPATYLTSAAIDCRDYSAIEVSYWRWLGVEDGRFDQASFEVSNDGVNWTTIWTNGNATISDSAWLEQRFDVSAVADGYETVYLRWSMGPTDDSVNYPGWNLDDICVYGIPAGTYDIMASAGPGGSITPSGTQTVSHASTPSYLIEAHPYYFVTNVVVDGIDLGSTNAYTFPPVTYGPRSIMAYFDAYRTSNGVPHWWLADRGHTNDFENAERADEDNDGHQNWQEWRAGTDPMDAQSVLGFGEDMAGMTMVNGRMPLAFPSVAGKTYRVRTADSLNGPWSLSAHAMGSADPLVTEPIAGTGGTITVYVEAADGVLFSVISVE